MFVDKYLTLLIGSSFRKKEKANSDQNLKDITDRNLMIWAAIAKGMNVKLDFMLQPVGSWCTKKMSVEEEEIFDEENKSNLFRIFKYADRQKYILFKDILKKSTEKYGINFIDCNEIFSDKKYDKEWIFSGRLHLTDKGNKYTAEALLKNFLIK